MLPKPMPGARPTRHPPESGRRALALALVLCASACTTPSLRLDLPAQVLLPASRAGITDERARFREIFCAVHEARRGSSADPEADPVADCDSNLHRLVDEPPSGDGGTVDLGPPRLRLRVAVVPGFGSDCFSHVVQVLEYAEQHLREVGYATLHVPIAGLASSSTNARLIRDSVMNAGLEPDERLVLIGYSKGAPDVMEALVTYPELAARTAAFVSMSGAVGGSVLADGQSDRIAVFLDSLPGLGCLPSDHGAVTSLRRPVRQRWLSEHPLPPELPRFSLVTMSAREATSRVLRPSWDRLARIDPRNDSQLLAVDQVLPGSALLGYAAADHWAVALPLGRNHPVLSVFLDHNEFPREVLLEAVVRHVEERLLEQASAGDRGRR